MKWTSGGNAGSIDTNKENGKKKGEHKGGHLAGTPALLTHRHPSAAFQQEGYVDIWRERRLYWHLEV